MKWQAKANMLKLCIAEKYLYGVKDLEAYYVTGTVRKQRRVS